MVADPRPVRESVASDTTTDPASERLSERFWAVARALRHLSQETLVPWAIAPSHARAVSVLRRHGQMRLGDLSEHLRIAARSTTEVVDALQEHGLVERRPDPLDRRATLVELTSDGREAARAISAARTEETERFFGGLSETDRRDLSRILGALAPDRPDRQGRRER